MQQGSVIREHRKVGPDARAERCGTTLPPQSNSLQVPVELSVWPVTA
jgi:hypothetical protein